MNIASSFPETSYKGVGIRLGHEVRGGGVLQSNTVMPWSVMARGWFE